MATETLLVEVGTEELPPKSLKRLMQSLGKSFASGLNDAGLSFSALHSHATPRRLALVVEGLIDRQPDQLIERRGPAVKAAYDADGNPSRALQGFMKSCGCDNQDELETLSTEKGEWLMYRATQPGAPLQELLEALVHQSLAALPIDRRMRWGSNRTEFVRPVQWLVCLYGQNVIPIEILGQTAGNQSKGHRFMSAGAFSLESANDYVEACRQQHVIVDFAERRNKIESAILAIAASESAHLEIDNDLLDEVTSLVEWPVALKGDFDPEFLVVPPEVLISAMKEHQRYFHLTNPETHELLPAFITVSNIESSDASIIIRGNERVIRPRLSDAAFFYTQDTKTNLSRKAERLQSVVFQTDLGTYGEKATRISSLAAYIAGQLNNDADAAQRAGLLCKADLVSDMVGEFPDLQGIMGGYYSRHDGESDDVVKGIEQHYRPTHSGGTLPEGIVASSVALADKIDTLVGLFGINQPPTGSRDPFALRRQSLGVIRICIENKLDFDLANAINQSAQLYGRSFATDEVAAYIVERLEGYYRDQDISRDHIDAALGGAASDINLVRIDKVIRAIQTFRQTPTAEQIIAANKRVANLLRKAALDELPAEYDPALANEQAESDLANALLVAVPQAGLDEADLDEERQLEMLADLQRPVDEFFDKVLVMADDVQIRNNRLALLRQLRNRFLEVADFSLLQ